MNLRLFDAKLLLRLQNSIAISHEDLLTITGPVNVSTAAQKLLFISSRLVTDLTVVAPVPKLVGLRSCVVEFRDAMRVLFPATTLAAASPKRAALLLARDLLTVVSEAVVPLSELEGFMRPFLDQRDIANVSESIGADSTVKCEYLSQRLSRVNSIFLRQVEVLNCESDIEANGIAAALQSDVASQRPDFSIHGSLPPTIRAQTTIAGSQKSGRLRGAGLDSNKGFTNTDSKAETVNQHLIPEPTHLAPEHLRAGPSTPRSSSPSLSMRDFEKVLFKLPVYSRNPDRYTPATASGSTIYTQPSSTVQNLTLADVSIVSVLRLPAKAETICNASSHLDGEAAFPMDTSSNLPHSGRLYTYVIPTSEMLAFEPHGALANAERYARELSTHLEISIHASRDEFIAAVKAYANINDTDRPMELYIRSGISLRALKSGDKPLLLLATVATEDEDPPELLLVMPIRHGEKQHESPDRQVFRTPREGVTEMGGISSQWADPTVQEKMVQSMSEPVDKLDEYRQHKEDEDTTWFALDTDDSREPILSEYRRYASVMMDCVQSGGAPQYPRLVPFIGETGAGKSALIRLLIGPTRQYDNPDSEPIAAPIIGRAVSDTPTSADVHLYLDPHTRHDTYPILFADCEGFRGGESSVAADNRLSPIETSSTAAISARDGKLLKNWGVRSKKRTLEWAQRNTLGSEEMSKRAFAVKQMYPQIFYAFCDVVVFVLTQPRTLEVVVEDLLVWADRNCKGSTNLPSKSHVIIAINRCESDTPEAQWDIDNATVHLLSSATSLITNIVTFVKYANIWANSGIEIDDMKDLLRRYYSSVHVVRIPRKSQYQLLNQQREKLYQLILDNCNRSSELKRCKQMSLDVDQFGAFLSVAFDHFAESLDVPFDFMKASLKSSPPPASFTENVERFVLTLHRNEHLHGHIRKLFTMLTPMVATCILLDSSRSRRMGNPMTWFIAKSDDSRSYASMCEEVIETYFDTQVSCAFQIKDVLHPDHQCILRRRTHHQGFHTANQGGLVYSYPGEFLHDFDSREVAWSYRVLEQVEKFQSSIGGDYGDANRHRWIGGHRDCVRRFFDDIGGAQLYKSQVTCLCCLSNPPEHHLPCEHVICTPCAIDFGRTDGLGRILVHECPICGGPERDRFEPAMIIRQPPPFSGQRVLVLDGGGARGIVELRVLEALENLLHVPLQRFFDLVVGSGTGGIISLAFGDQYMSIKECIVAFEALVQRAFTPRSGQGVHVIRHVQKYLKRSKYETRPLEEALKRVFAPEQQLFGQRESHRAERLNVSVTATSGTGSTGYILSNYNARTSPKIANCIRYRPEDSRNELRFWEAARSTSAAVGFFKPYMRDPSTMNPPESIDGGLFQNSPVQIALEESRSLAKTRNQTAKPDIFLSIGTGLPGGYKARKGELPFFDVQSSDFSWHRVLFSLVRSQIQMNLMAEKRWREQLAAEPDLRNRMFRINPWLGKEPPEMDDTHCVPELSKTVAYDLQHNDELRSTLRKVACTLAASVFYFELRSTLSERSGTIRLEGIIKCALSMDEDHIKGLVRFLSESRPSFLIQSTQQYIKDQDLKLPIHAMLEHGAFPGLDVVIEVPGEEVETKISLKLPGMAPGGQLYNISGFPRCLFRADAGNSSRQRSLD